MRSVMLATRSLIRATRPSLDWRRAQSLESDMFFVFPGSACCAMSKSLHVTV
jgi:hypothetical protein